MPMQWCDGLVAAFAVVLDDLVSMSPDRPMSKAETVEILVRLSATGTAEAAPGDWRWLSEPFHEPVE